MPAKGVCRGATAASCESAGRATAHPGSRRHPAGPGQTDDSHPAGQGTTRPGWGARPRAGGRPPHRPASPSDPARGPSAAERPSGPPSGGPFRLVRGHRTSARRSASRGARSGAPVVPLGGSGRTVSPGGGERSARWRGNGQPRWRPDSQARWRGTLSPVAGNGQAWWRGTLSPGGRDRSAPVGAAGQSGPVAENAQPRWERPDGQPRWRGPVSPVAPGGTRRALAALRPRVPPPRPATDQSTWETNPRKGKWPSSERRSATMPSNKALHRWLTSIGSRRA
jgi:hypothetical protein